MRASMRMMRQEPVWGVAYLAALLLPWMLVFSRLGAEICCALAGLAFLWHSIRTRDWSWTRDPFLLVCLLAYLWLVLVVTPLALDPSASFKEALTWFRMPLLFASLRYFVLVRREARVGLAWTGALLLALVMVDTLWQFAHGISLSGMVAPGNGRLSGPFNAPKVGLFIAKLLLPIAALLFVFGPTRQRRNVIAAAGLLLVGLMTIILSGERSAFLSTVLGAAVVMALLVLRDKRLRGPCLLATAGGIVLAAGLYLSTPTVQVRAQQMLQVMQHYPQSDYGVLAAAGVRMGIDHPLHGVGLKGFRALCPELAYAGGTFRGMHPHNVFVEWFCEAGVVGLLLLIGMLGMLAREAWRALGAAQGAQRLLPAVALGVLVQHFFPLMGMQSYFTNWPALLVWFSLSAAFAGLPLLHKKTQ
ncbi:MAG: O-antigen ligase family protein [Pseudomonadota bacterium]